MKVRYNPELKKLARNLRNKSTKSEISLWKYLNCQQIDGYKFSRQKPIGNYIADFYCYQLRLVIEIDGSSHNSLDIQEKDKLKEIYLKQLGFTVLRFTGYDVFENIEGVVQSIRNYIIEFENLHTP